MPATCAKLVPDAATIMLLETDAPEIGVAEPAAP